MAGQNALVERGLEDFLKLKRLMDKYLSERDYSAWSRAVVRFRGDLCIASMGAVSINRDIDGNQLQDLQELNVDMQELPFGIVATDEGGAAVFTWLTRDPVPSEFVKNLLSKGHRRLPGLLAQFMFAYIENTYFSGDWWMSLSQADREQIQDLAAIADAYYTEFKYSHSLTFVPWEITDVEISTG